MNDKKKVKINFIGFWPGFTPEENVVYRILKKYYDVEITDNADYILCSIFEPKYSYCNYPGVRIMCVGENYVPDFNLVDYAISRYSIDYLDRNFYLIGCADIGSGMRWFELEDKDRNYSIDFLRQKEFFANFIAGHESEDSIRGDFFKLLDQYKRVESVGTYLNNMPDGKAVSFMNDSKTDFQRKCKFTLCFESTAHEGFITEKISDAFFADTIPVYFGSTNVTDIFNKKAFIQCNGRDDFERTLQQIIELDNDDEKYMEMLRQPIFVRKDYPSANQAKLEAFVRHIFDQPIESAYRRSRVYHPLWHEEYLKKARIYEKISLWQRVRNHINRLIKK